jgi:hypothetical protein
MTQNTTTENQEQQENPQSQEMQENDAALEFTAAVTLGATVVAISDAAVSAATAGAVHLPAQAEMFVVTMIGIGAFGMVLCYVARQATKLRLAAHNQYEAPTVAEAPEGAPVRL